MTKSVSLDISYVLDPSIDRLYMRNGLSPNTLFTIARGSRWLPIKRLYQWIL